MGNDSYSLNQSLTQNDCFSILFKNLEQINDFGLYCLFAPHHQSYKDKKTLTHQFKLSYANVSATKEGLNLLTRAVEILKKKFSLRALAEIELLSEQADDSEDFKFIFYVMLAAIMQNCVNKAGKTPPHHQRCRPIKGG